MNDTLRAPRKLKLVLLNRLRDNPVENVSFWNAFFLPKAMKMMLVR